MFIYSDNIVSSHQVGFHSNVTLVILLGFSNLGNVRILFFLALSIIYCLTISGNLLIVTLFLLSKNLQTPMYFFITQLSLCDIMLSTIILPNLLQIVLHNGCLISLVGCIIQFSFFGSSEVSECYLLTVMSYDRYLAICKPLHYNTIMSPMFCRKSVIFIWLLGFLLMLIDSIPMCALDFCGPNIIDHFYCDFEPILSLSCSDTSWLHTQSLIPGIFAIILPFIIILVSYICIVLTILKIPTVVGRQKPFATCSSHLTVVSIYYGTLIIVYMFPKTEQTSNQGKILSLCYTVITPLLNPIIYTFRNKDFKKAFKVVTSGTKL